jgi:hypothetical protein
MERWVQHFDMDAFFASVEQLTRPTLRGRPVLVGGRGGRGVVAGASYEARAFGARSAMPMHQARRLIGSAAVVLPPRGAVYGVASRRVMDTVRTMVPVLEQLSFDEAFGEPAELAGADAETVERFCARLRLRVRERTGSTPLRCLVERGWYPEFTEELEAEGWAKDRIRELQDLRKSTGLDVSDRIAVRMAVPAERAQWARTHRDLIAGEILATSFDFVEPAEGLAVEIGDGVWVAIAKA